MRRAARAPRHAEGAGGRGLCAAVRNEPTQLVATRGGVALTRVPWLYETQGAQRW
jgi:hypothetical protein